MRKSLILILAGSLATLASCATTSSPPPLPTSGPIIYSCANGTQLQASFVGDEARIAIVGGISLTLPNTGAEEAPNYSNGRYSLRGRGAEATWQTPGAAPTACRGQ